ncbi:MAG: 23S rRNA (adenine(2030)-N(6))-methyltransferase RlmJ [Chromatiales bacterium]|nr:23S rRNA (adenine(2030)-N(6))-methyltransferase RlmJ [Gammaproteobacteria bacterium]MCP5352565.1 23S rRNA (adenine(2030)-N(6))-methyltransferase RlmJ [Chromatiales bacterium]
MLGYRHAFHAGNHGDVLKHLVLRECLTYLNHKPKPWLYVDTHAGAGAYDLNGAQAGRNREFEGGIARLRGGEPLPAALADLLAAVDAAGPDVYPGSPVLAAQLARPEDRLRLYELHSSDFPQLRQRFARDRRVRCERSDGYIGLRAQLPPPTRRGLALIDPSYELNSDYGAVVDALRDGLLRFETGLFLIWYPQLPQAAARHLPGNLRAACDRPWLDVSLSVQSPSRSGLGMYGSGMFVVNPPFGLADTLRDCLPVLAGRLGTGSDAGFNLEQSAA